MKNQIQREILLTGMRILGWSELFDKEGKIKVVHSPHISSAGNLL